LTFYVTHRQLDGWVAVCEPVDTALSRTAAGVQPWTPYRDDRAAAATIIHFLVVYHALQHIQAPSDSVDM
jgi:hypothetical protein